VWLNDRSAFISLEDRSQANDG